MTLFSSHLPCWSVFRDTSALRENCRFFAYTCGMDIGDWVRLNCEFARSWSCGQYSLKVAKLVGLVNDTPVGFISDQYRRQNGFGVLLYQLCEASRQWGGTLPQVTILRLCDMLRVGALLFEELRLSDPQMESIPTPGCFLRLIDYMFR